MPIGRRLSRRLNSIQGKAPPGKKQEKGTETTKKTKSRSTTFMSENYSKHVSALTVLRQKWL